jgi:hypothetical protein
VFGVPDGDVVLPSKSLEIFLTLELLLDGTSAGKIKVEKRVPHLKACEHCNEEIFACIFMPNQTPIWFGFVFFFEAVSRCSFFRVRVTTTTPRRVKCRDLNMAMMCVICHNINFQASRTAKRKCNFQRAITINPQRT